MSKGVVIMIKVELTKNYTGVNISGEYEDLDFLYDSINYLIRNTAKSLLEESMQDHLYGFLYDVRHCYQGDRILKLVDNGLRKEVRKWNSIPKKDVTDNNLHYSFDYVLTELFTDMVLIKHFILSMPATEKNDYNPYLNNVKLFYSHIFNLMDQILTPIKMKKLEKGLIDTIISDKIFCPQWFENITCDYLKQSKEKRIKNLSKILDSIYNYDKYIDYSEMKLEVEKYCKENNCLPTDVHMCEYPREIEW